MVKPKGKHAYHKADMNKVNRVALAIGGTTAAVILILIIFSFIR